METNQNRTQEVNQRMLVLEMLLTENAYSHVIVRDVLNKYNYLSQQEKAFIKRLYEGNLERQIELDYVIDLYSKVKTNKMKKPIRAIMRMGVYQILYMDAVPDAAPSFRPVPRAPYARRSQLSPYRYQCSLTHPGSGLSPAAPLEALRAQFPLYLPRAVPSTDQRSTAAWNT